MSDCVPFDIQMEIIKKVSEVKSLIRFRSVSKHWKSFIDSQHSCRFVYLSYKKKNKKFVDEAKYICFDDNNEPVSNAVVVSPIVKQCSITQVVGACHGLLCLYCSRRRDANLLVIWNLSIQKSIGVVVPSVEKYIPTFGFGVCPVTKDPTVVKLKGGVYGMPRHCEVFTLSSGVWTEIPPGNCPRKTILFTDQTHVVIDGSIYWAASETTTVDDGTSTRNLMLVSFDLITKEFRVLDLPKSLTDELLTKSRVRVCKLRESLVVYGCIVGEESFCCGVWVMEHDSSFTKLFTIGSYVDTILGFRKSGEPICEVYKSSNGPTTLHVWCPCSHQFKNLIAGGNRSSFIGSYKESLLLLDHSDSHIYAGEIEDKDDSHISSCPPQMEGVKSEIHSKN